MDDEGSDFVLRRAHLIINGTKALNSASLCSLEPTNIARDIIIGPRKDYTSRKKPDVYLLYPQQRKAISFRLKEMAIV